MSFREIFQNFLKRAKSAKQLKHENKTEAILLKEEEAKKLASKIAQDRAKALECIDELPAKLHLSTQAGLTLHIIKDFGAINDDNKIIDKAIVLL